MADILTMIQLGTCRYSAHVFKELINSFEYHRVCNPTPPPPPPTHTSFQGQNSACGMGGGGRGGDYYISLTFCYYFCVEALFHTYTDSGATSDLHMEFVTAFLFPMACGVINSVLLQVSPLHGNVIVLAL